jgi:hypothetical protein
MKWQVERIDYHCGGILLAHRMLYLSVSRLRLLVRLRRVAD